ncbi:hypothetical protein Tco_0961110 [Tanacetum coccineum]
MAGNSFSESLKKSKSSKQLTIGSGGRNKGSEVGAIRRIEWVRYGVSGVSWSRDHDSGDARDLVMIAGNAVVVDVISEDAKVLGVIFEYITVYCITLDVMTE